MHQALLWDKEEENHVHCKLCSQRCLIAPGKRGICQVRENQDGTLYTLVYGELIAESVDPIEKKPLFHFFPGSRSFSIATPGCNFRCRFCQNADISQMPHDSDAIRGRQVPAETVVTAARRYACRSISYTYTEPTIFFEYNYDVARLAHEAMLANVYVTNGYMTPEMLEMVTSTSRPPLIDAANVDLKAFRDETYRRECGASLQPVLDSLKMIKQRRVWLEVTTLVIPMLNDSDGELRDIADFIAKELGPETPWHVSRFHPTYRMMDRPPTPASVVHRAREIGLAAGLKYVYVGNVTSAGGEDTVCPGCKHAVIRRSGFTVLRHEAQEGRCPHCGTKIDGVGL